VLSDSVESALSALRQEQFDAVITDIAMPFADGYDFIAALRRLPEDRGGSTPAIALTAFAHPDDRRRLLASGFQAYIAKPFRMTDVFAAIAEVVSQARRRAS
jgi:CheY-like chemotaxis protein